MDAGGRFQTDVVEWLLNVCQARESFNPQIHCENVPQKRVMLTTCVEVGGVTVEVGGVCSRPAVGRQ